MGASNENRAQLLHWRLAIERLANLEDSASAEGWSRIERDTNSVIRASLSRTINELRRSADRLAVRIESEENPDVSADIQRIREDYLRTERVVEFFADAINTRSSKKIGDILRGLDRIALEGMHRILRPLGYSAPPTLVFKSRGEGAAILRSGQYLWDRRSVNPVEAIKVVTHNLYTCTSILHEVGHAIGHRTGWKDELGEALAEAIPGPLGKIWQSWRSEVSSDAISLVYCGHASASALRTVLDSGPARVYRFHLGDSHPIGLLRVEMMCAFADRCFGEDTRPLRGNDPGVRAPWRSLRDAWIDKYPLSNAGEDVKKIVTDSRPLLPRIADVVLARRFRSLNGRSLISIIDPSPAAPVALYEFERQAGPRAFELPYVVTKEAIRLMALSGLVIATDGSRAEDYYRKQEQALTVLGAQALAA